MTRNRKFIVIASFIVVIGLGVAGAFIARSITTPSTASAPATTHTDTPETVAEQTEKADVAFKAALTAMNSGNTTEAKKQLDIALALYTAVHNEDGIANVNAQYLILNGAPKKPAQPNVVTN